MSLHTLLQPPAPGSLPLPPLWSPLPCISKPSAVDTRGLSAMTPAERKR